MSVRTQFSIKDLENLSQVKAHTIRIWEKRYNLLQPSRTDTNIRKYDLESLKKLLNVSLLYREGYKISKIAELSDGEIHEIINEQSQLKKESFAVNSMKKAMFEFNVALFNSTYNDLIKEYTFEFIFSNVFIPLLDDIGSLWQTNTIDPAHESFISELVKQKIIVNIEREQQEVRIQHTATICLFLPYDEIHEIGLMYSHFEAVKAGFRTLYLGSNIPLNSLKFLLQQQQEIVFISYLTLLPEGLQPKEYIDKFQYEICNLKSCNLWLSGRKAQKLQSEKLPKNIKILSSIEQLQDALDTLKVS